MTPNQGGNAGNSGNSGGRSGSPGGSPGGASNRSNNPSDNLSPQDRIKGGEESAGSQDRDDKVSLLALRAVQAVAHPDAQEDPAAAVDLLTWVDRVVQAAQAEAPVMITVTLEAPEVANVAAPKAERIDNRSALFSCNGI